MRAAIARSAVLGLSALLLSSSATAADREPLSLGDPTPALDVGEWVEGEAVTIGEENVYVVLFWQSTSGTGAIDEETSKSIARLRSLLELYGPDAEWASLHADMALQTFQMGLDYEGLDLEAQARAEGNRIRIEFQLSGFFNLLDQLDG